ncbi:MAG TPA: M90 family metallopeptidase [Ilumatobacteraceae bacterium]|nr:M90 family metallopeptidase [Ilumatobacteraceae bacterium]
MIGSLRRRLQRRRTPPAFDPRWRSTLEAGFAHWSLLTDTERERLEHLISSMFHRTRWEAARGFELTESIKVLVSAQASMLLLGLDLDEYPQLTSVILHPSTVRLRGEHSVGGSVRSSSVQTLSGQAHYRGPVVLSWHAARRGAQFPAGGTNVVYHEFAHQLDMLDGLTDGTPPMIDEVARQRWVEVCTRAYDGVRAEGSPVLRPYAGTNPAEFFAVATEVFFNRPVELSEHEPDLYAELCAFYGQDPAARLRRFLDVGQTDDAAS